MTREGRLLVSMKSGGSGVQSVLWFWGFFVSPTAKYALGAMRCPTCHLGARDERIGIHEIFLAGVLAMGTGIDYAASHMPPRLPAVSTRVQLFRAGPVAACDSGRLPLSPGVFSLSVAAWAQCYADAGFFILSAGLGHVFSFSLSSSPVLPCSAVHICMGAFSPGLSSSHDAGFRGRMIWIVLRHVKNLSLYLTVAVGRHLG